MSISLFKLVNKLLVTDPVKHCKTYKSQGCSFVDGIGCDMKTCTFKDTKCVAVICRDGHEFFTWVKKDLGEHKVLHSTVNRVYTKDTTYIKVSHITDTKGFKFNYRILATPKKFAFHLYELTAYVDKISKA